MEKRILLVEDDFYIRELYVRQFRLAGYTIDQIANGNDVMAAVKNAVYAITIFLAFISKKISARNLNLMRHALPIIKTGRINVIHPGGPNIPKELIMIS